MCAKEIAYYRRLDRHHTIDWHDVADSAASCPIGYDQATLLARFHVQELATGRVFSGAAGFARMWQALPGFWSSIGWLAGARPFVWVLEWGYRLTLRVRPFLARHVFKRQSTQ
jgi:predicted DCC family thiol-disulfide oxidoreductase YuxK